MAGVVHQRAPMASSPLPPGQTPLEKALAAGLLAAWVSLGVAGLFDYNFGDSEVLMLWLTLPAWVVPEGAAREEVGG